MWPFLVLIKKVKWHGTLPLVCVKCITARKLHQHSRKMLQLFSYFVSQMYKLVTIAFYDYHLLDVD